MESSNTSLNNDNDFLNLNLDNLLNNFTDDDLYNTFLSTENSQVDSVLPITLPSNDFENQEFPDLSAIDFSALLSHPVKEEPSEEQVTSPHFEEVKQEQESRKRRNTQDAKSNKKPKLMKQEVVVVDEKYKKRLAANKKSAQASRERKKQLKVELEARVKELSQENKELSRTMTELETENKVLKQEFVTLQNLINNSSVLSKLMSRATSYFMPTSTMEAVDLEKNPSLNSAAAMYLMVVLYSFSQHFKTASPFGNQALSVPAITTVA